MIRLKIIIWFAGVIAWSFALFERSYQARLPIDLVLFLIVMLFWALWLFMYPAQND